MARVSDRRQKGEVKMNTVGAHKFRRKQNTPHTNPNEYKIIQHTNAKRPYAMKPLDTLLRLTHYTLGLTSTFFFFIIRETSDFGAGIECAREIR